MCKLVKSSFNIDEKKRVKLWYNGVEKRYIVQVFSINGVSELISDNITDCLVFMRTGNLEYAT